MKWFGMIYSKQGMSKDPEKMEQVSKWKAPTDKSGVEFFTNNPILQVFLETKGWKDIR